MSIATIVLAAGHGTRMKSTKPKVLHEIGGLSMLGHVMASAAKVNPERRAVVIGDHAPAVGDAAKKIDPDVYVGVQAPPQGTGDAVMKALPALDGFEGIVVVLYADTPFVTPVTVMALVEEIRDGAAVAVLGFRPPDPGAYGRLKLADDGSLEAIVEAKDASQEELAIDLVNSGVMAFDAAALKAGLPKLSPENAKNEYYLTDLVAISRKEKLTCAVVETDEEEVIGVNSRLELAMAEEIFQDGMRLRAMANGVTLIDPPTTYFAHDTELGEDIVIEPSVFFGPGVKIERGVHIKAFSHIEEAYIDQGAVIGPFARIRPGTAIGQGARIGNFVEVKKSRLDEGAKVNHLTYVGDAEIGAGANIGAGTITCNYDGFNKHKTVIGKEAFIGSNSSLVAPVTIEEGAYVGSGSVITKNVEKDALAVSRGRQSVIAGWAARFRNSKS
ncbi:MAG: bifunctional UDP-N-acetylglucosamine diphosphorylase/glucosamine-1-phosphate N-acetyltransferase GlmU [Pseudomonadota bacterium]